MLFLVRRLYPMINIFSEALIKKRVFEVSIDSYSS